MSFFLIASPGMNGPNIRYIHITYIHKHRYGHDHWNIHNHIHEYTYTSRCLNNIVLVIHKVRFTSNSTSLILKLNISLFCVSDKVEHVVLVLSSSLWPFR